MEMRVWTKNVSVDKKIECGQKKIDDVQKFLSVLSMSVSVGCGVWSVEYDSAVSGEPPSKWVLRIYPTNTNSVRPILLF